MGEYEQSIPEKWIKSYVDSLIQVAKLYSKAHAMHQSRLLRAEAIMDMLEEYRHSQRKTKTTSEAKWQDSGIDLRGPQCNCDQIVYGDEIHHRETCPQYQPTSKADDE